MRGFGRFLDDVTEPPETLHITFVRSPIAHGLIRSIDTVAAAALPGVVAVVTAADIGDAIKPMRSDYDRPGFHPTDWPVIAAERVRYVGEIVAVVLAESPYVAEDAVDLVAVDYELLSAVTTVEDALAPEAPPVHQEIGTNVLFHNAFKTEGSTKYLMPPITSLAMNFITTESPRSRWNLAASWSTTIAARMRLSSMRRLRCRICTATVWLSISVSRTPKFA